MFEHVPKPEPPEDKDRKTEIQTRLIELDAAIKIAERTLGSEVNGSEAYKRLGKRLSILAAERDELLSGSFDDLGEGEIDEALDALDDRAA